jgi:hypothetical protein
VTMSVMNCWLSMLEPAFFIVRSLIRRRSMAIPSNCAKAALGRCCLPGRTSRLAASSVHARILSSLRSSPKCSQGSPCGESSLRQTGRTLSRFVASHIFLDRKRRFSPHRSPNFRKRRELRAHVAVEPEFGGRRLSRIRPAITSAP